MFVYSYIKIMGIIKTFVYGPPRTFNGCIISYININGKNFLKIIVDKQKQ